MYLKLNRVAIERVGFSAHTIVSLITYVWADNCSLWYCLLLVSFACSTVLGNPQVLPIQNKIWVHFP